MNKTELIAAIAEKADITKFKAASILDTVIDSIGSALRADDKVTLVGFGTFSVTARAARIGRNPRDGKAIKIPAKKVAKKVKKKADNKAGKK